MTASAGFNSPDEREQALFTTLARLPAGSVVGYGQLARLAGLGNAARWVGRALGRLPADSTLPWHRVVGADGRLALAAGTPAGERQRARLRKEGVQLVNDRVNMRVHGWLSAERNG
ncbi:MGMT family protein [Stutzerimonas tarimensis]|uniref:MGMT family protein n=1 Tax=Stutzerimonas tarimensis TaxID=1507735 RepID=A0ABV7T2N1_9GAMM